MTDKHERDLNITELLRDIAERTSARLASGDEAVMHLEFLLKALSLGPLDVAAMYGPDVHHDQPVRDAAENARAFLEARKP